MGALASLATPEVAVEPGHTVSWTVTVRNTGSVVDEFTLTVLGDAASWSVVEPATLSLFPGAEATADVRFSPERVATMASGVVPVGVKVASREDAAGSTVEEANLTVGRFLEMAAELVPRMSRGRRGGRHEVAIDNRGNGPLRLRLRGLDVDNLLALDVTPEVLAPAPGTAAFGRVRVVARKRFLRGTPQSRPFQLVAESDDAPPVTLDGAFLQEALIPKWLLMALIGLLLAILLLWFALIRPQIQSAAKDAVGEELAVSEQPVVAEEETPADGGGAGGGDAAGGGAGGGGGGEEAPGVTEPAPSIEPVPPSSLVPVAPPTTTITTIVPIKGTPIDGRLFLNESGSAAFTVPANNRLQLTDLVLQNPNGNSGTIQIRRDGITLLVVALDNFRDLDYHFVSPIAFNPGQRLVFAAQCTSEDCSPSVYYNGLLEAVPR